MRTKPQAQRYSKRRADMQTERASPRYSGIDTWDIPDVLDALIEGQFAAVAAVRAARPAIEAAVTAAHATLSDRGRLVYAGAGTSGRLAVQDGAELMPTFSWPPERLLLLMAGGSDALIGAVEGAEDEIEDARRLVEAHQIGSDDVLVAVAASGVTPFTLSCLREANRRGALTIGIANNAGTPLLEEAQHAIWLDTGAEPIAGSTRMKAGTSQRVALTVFSSLLMITLGRIYEGMMVDLQAANAKLARRSEDMLTSLTGKSREEARAALERAEGSVKVAVLLLNGCEIEEARLLLERAGGQLRQALALFEQRGNEAA
jgi:N-acetylmuramic acid 6-phosphate etherase